MKGFSSIIPLGGVTGASSDLGWVLSACRRLTVHQQKPGCNVMMKKRKKRKEIPPNEGQRPAELWRLGERGLRFTSSNRRWTWVSCFLILITLSHSVFAFVPSHQLGLLAPGSELQNRAPSANETSPLLECFEVSPPVLSPTKESCQKTLMVHTFAWSYGHPFVGDYTPPDCSFNRVTLNFTVTSAGRQFDRLALMFFGDTEIWRTSTAEPTAKGIVWTSIKDVSNYVSLLKVPQKIIFDLGNLVDDTYTGSWNTTLTATFFTSGDVDPADVIIPISARRSAENSPSGFVIPDSKALNSLAIPRNIRKAIFSISACGQSSEEFWWSNVLSSDTKTFGNVSTLYGHSPFRELQLYIDDSLAGVAWPFPVIFTGGVVPGFWRPIVGIDAFDLREDEIDITPFLPALSDGKEHTFEIRVAGIDDDGLGNGILTTAIGSNWLVTGKIFLWFDTKGSITKGTPPIHSTSNLRINLSSSRQVDGNSTVKSLNYNVEVARILNVSSIITTSSGSKLVTWYQDLTYSNVGRLTSSGNDQETWQSTSGTHQAIGSSVSNYSKTFSYPLYVASSYNLLSGGNFTITGKMSRGKDLQKQGSLAFPSELQTFINAPQSYRPFTGSSSTNWQNGTASYFGAPAFKHSFGAGSTEQWYWLYGVGDAAENAPGAATGQGITELYRRHVWAANDSLILDEESLGGGGSVVMQLNGGENRGTDAPVFAKDSIIGMLGRGLP